MSEGAIKGSFGCEPETTRWLVMVGGTPKEPDYNDILRAEPPGPMMLLDALLEESGVDKPQTVVTDERKDVTTRESRGFHGTTLTGYQWSTLRFTDSSSFPLHLTVTVYGMPWLELEWTYELAWMGQLEHCAYRHRHLRVRFTGPEAQVRFTKLWCRIFKMEPTFQPEAGDGD